MSWSAVLASAHVKVLVNGRLLGVCTGFSSRTRTPMKALGGIDTSLTFEIAPTTYEVSGSVQVLRGRLSGGLEGVGLIGFAKDLLRQKYSTIEMVDIQSGATIYRATGCMVEEQAWTTSPKGLVTGQFSFRGIEVSNEADI